MKYIIETEQRRNEALRHLQHIGITKPLEVHIKPYKPNRTRSQNSTLWMWYTPLSDYTGYSEEELHELFKATCIGYEIFTIDGTPYIRPKSSTRLTIKGMMKMLNAVETVAKCLDVVLPYPDDVNMTQAKVKVKVG